MRTIALEEHFATPAYFEGPARRLKGQAERAGGRFAALIAQLVDVDDGRVAAMDAAGMDVQALSLTSPGVEQLNAEAARSFARTLRSRKPSDVIRSDFSAWRRCAQSSKREARAARMAKAASTGAAGAKRTDPRHRLSLSTTASIALAFSAALQAGSFAMTEFSM